MATIDNLDININNLFAVRAHYVEQFNREMRLDQAGSIPPQTQILNTYPLRPEIELLLGIVPLHTPWAHFYPPKRFMSKRQSPFGFARILPSLGSQSDQDEDEEKARNTECETEEEEEERKAIIKCFGHITKINQWLSHVVGRMGQFLQG